MSQPSRLSGKSQIIRMLVAEDDSFQRLALIDILTLCNYDGKVCYNFKISFLMHSLKKPLKHHFSSGCGRKWSSCKRRASQGRFKF